MADLIEKIGRFFAEQEAQIQDTFTQIAYAPSHSSLSQSKPPPPVHKIPTQLPTQQYDRGSPVTNVFSKPHRSNSIRGRRSVKHATEPTQSQSWHDEINEILDAVQPQSTRELSTLKSSVPLPPSRPIEPKPDIWNHQSDDFVSWRSSSSLGSSRGHTRDDDVTSHVSSEAPEKHRKPRPPHQKHRKRSRKKKHPNNQEEEKPDPKAVAKANAAKVAAALMLAQERAKRFKQEKLQLEREQELERQEAASRLHKQMVKIEAVRARSFRQQSSMTTARSTLSSCDNQDTESVWTADSNDVMETERQPSQFMVNMEAQLREKMSLEMHVKQSYVEKHKKRERVRLKLEKALLQNVGQSSKVARLSATKASLEMELANVLEDTAQTRQKRRELELADEKERLKRQREAERALQIRLREEEWETMMEEEKARSQVAAEARAKASKRVEAHSAKLRKMMQAYRYEPHHSSSSSIPSSARSNNDSEHSDEESSESSSRASTENLSKPFKMDFLLPPELADFEEDGLCNNNEHLQPETSFRWQVSSYPDPVKFTEVLVNMVSDDEE
ncbi:hypothetical protein AM587_10008195 [Phytophthora nicotianae]|uniref:Uncharacterized protein n=1 Tax=Phytophthora nicotianae TaxID=4792 RepID=A0A0W8CBZ7_PHYNI|nr:hypothetical protein L916_12354 [Phytophthora nicotianae]KUF78693.1 hypothetical protein AM587_10011253 [Phytophthora nicotianae]KUF81590.1 hypothetical protein AM587_10008195 [Phytophthora nicotianae]